MAVERKRRMQRKREKKGTINRKAKRDKQKEGL